MTNVKRRGKSANAASLYTSFKVRKSLFKDSIESFYEALDTPVSLSCYLLYKYGENDQLVKKALNPRLYIDAETLKLDFAAVSFLRKSKVLATSFDKRKLAIDGFVASENHCREMNLRFDDLALEPLYNGSNVYLLHAMTRKIATILGTYDPSEFFDNGAWGPGTTISIKGSNTSAARKFRYEKQITRKLYTLVSGSLQHEYPNWFLDERAVTDLNINNCSEILTVPKNAAIDRTILVEPGLNTWFQKSVGNSIRDKLRRYGYDLNSDELNQNIARLSSKDGGAATVDFTDASNNICYNLVRETLPGDWFYILDACRTPCYNLDGTVSPLKKFSSMGNGFTFELESLIFLAAALAVTEYLDLDPSAVSVFGDDITIDAAGFDLYRSFTSFLGFTVSVEKSFGSDTLFRESCGSYYFDGIDVKPHFQKEGIQNAKSIFKLANGIRRLAHRFNSCCSCDDRFRPLHTSLVEYLPKPIRLKGDSSLGDVCFASNFDEANPALADFGWEGFLTPIFAEVPVKLEWDSPAVLLARLWYPSKDTALNNAVPLRSVTSVRRKMVLVQQWYNFGPWA